MLHFRLLDSSLSHAVTLIQRFSIAMDSPARSKGRKYGFACLVCRRRKVKCDGRRPTCINCARLKETCSYKGNSAYTSHLSEKLKSAQAQVQELQRQIRELAALDSAARDRYLAHLVSQLDLNERDQEGMRLGTEDVDTSAIDGIEEIPIGEDDSYDERADFSVDTEGRVSQTIALYPIAQGPE